MSIQGGAVSVSANQAQACCVNLTWWGRLLLWPFELLGALVNFIALLYNYRLFILITVAAALIGVGWGEAGTEITEAVTFIWDCFIVPIYNGIVRFVLDVVRLIYNFFICWYNFIAGTGRALSNVFFDLLFSEDCIDIEGILLTSLRLVGDVFQVFLIDWLFMDGLTDTFIDTTPIFEEVALLSQFLQDTLTCVCNLFSPLYDIVLQPLRDENLPCIVNGVFNAALVVVHTLFKLILNLITLTVPDRPDFKPLFDFLCEAVDCAATFLDNIIINISVQLIDIIPGADVAGAEELREFRFFCILSRSICVLLRLASFLVDLIFNFDLIFDPNFPWLSTTSFIDDFFFSIIALPVEKDFEFCADLNKNGQCDLILEDLNNDGKCNVLDCVNSVQPGEALTDCICEFFGPIEVLLTGQNDRIFCCTINSILATLTYASRFLYEVIVNVYRLPDWFNNGEYISRFNDFIGAFISIGDCIEGLFALAEKCLGRILGFAFKFVGELLASILRIFGFFPRLRDYFCTKPSEAALMAVEMSFGVAAANQLREDTAECIDLERLFSLIRVKRDIFDLPDVSDEPDNIPACGVRETDLGLAECGITECFCSYLDLFLEEFIGPNNVDLCCAVRYTIRWVVATVDLILRILFNIWQLRAVLICNPDNLAEFPICAQFDESIVELEAFLRCPCEFAELIPNDDPVAQYFFELTSCFCPLAEGRECPTDTAGLFFGIASLGAEIIRFIAALIQESFLIDDPGFCGTPLESPNAERCPVFDEFFSILDALERIVISAGCFVGNLFGIPCVDEDDFGDLACRLQILLSAAFRALRAIPEVLIEIIRAFVSMADAEEIIELVLLKVIVFPAFGKDPASTDFPPDLSRSEDIGLVQASGIVIGCAIPGVDEFFVRLGNFFRGLAIVIVKAVTCIIGLISILFGDVDNIEDKFLCLIEVFFEFLEAFLVGLLNAIIDGLGDILSPLFDVVDCFLNLTECIFGGGEDEKRSIDIGRNTATERQLTTELAKEFEGDDFFCGVVMRRNAGKLTEEISSSDRLAIMGCVRELDQGRQFVARYPNTPPDLFYNPNTMADISMQVVHGFAIVSSWQTNYSKYHDNLTPTKSLEENLRNNGVEDDFTVKLMQDVWHLSKHQPHTSLDHYQYDEDFTRLGFHYHGSSSAPQQFHLRSAELDFYKQRIPRSGDYVSEWHSALNKASKKENYTFAVFGQPSFRSPRKYNDVRLQRLMRLRDKTSRERLLHMAKEAEKKRKPFIFLAAEALENTIDFAFNMTYKAYDALTSTTYKKTGYVTDKVVEHVREVTVPRATEIFNTWIQPHSDKAKDNRAKLSKGYHMIMAHARPEEYDLHKLYEVGLIDEENYLRLQKRLPFGIDENEFPFNCDSVNCLFLCKFIEDFLIRLERCVNRTQDQISKRSIDVQRRYAPRDVRVKELSDVSFTETWRDLEQRSYKRKRDVWRYGTDNETELAELKNISFSDWFFNTYSHDDFSKFHTRRNDPNAAFNFSNRFFEIFFQVFGVDLEQIIQDVADWFTNTNNDINDGEVGLLFYVRFLFTCDLEYNLDCSRGIGLQDAVIVALIVLGVLFGLSFFFQFDLGILGGMIIGIAFVLFIAALAWFYSPFCLYFSPPTYLPVFPECVLDELIDLTDAIFVKIPWPEECLVQNAMNDQMVCPSVPQLVDPATFGFNDVIDVLIYPIVRYIPFGYEILKETCVNFIAVVFPFLTERIEQWSDQTFVEDAATECAFYFAIPLYLVIIPIVFGIYIVLLAFIPVIISLFTYLYSILITLPFISIIFGRSRSYNDTVLLTSSLASRNTQTRQISNSIQMEVPKLLADAMQSPHLLESDRMEDTKDKMEEDDEIKIIQQQIEKLSMQVNRLQAENDHLKEDKPYIHFDGKEKAD